MSMRDEFEKWWSPQGHKTMMTDTNRTAWRAWQAAREQGAEPVAYLIRQEFTGRLEVFDHRDKGRDPKYYGSPFAVYTQPQSAGYFLSMQRYSANKPTNWSKNNDSRNISRSNEQD